MSTKLFLVIHLLKPRDDKVLRDKCRSSSRSKLYGVAMCRFSATTYNCYITDDIITEALASTFQSISYHLFAYDSCLKLPCLINPYTHKATHPRYEPTGAFFSRQNNERAHVLRNFKSNVVLANSLFTEENYSHGSWHWSLQDWTTLPWNSKNILLRILILLWVFININQRAEI